jgi:hypothetical protein
VSKLQFYCFNCKIKQWFESYLNNRYQTTQILENECNLTGSSLWGKITDDVPQGSVLGRLLFLIYINDLPKVANDNIILDLFADDTSILVNWSGHVDYIIPKLSSACYIIRSVKPYMPLNTLKSIYYSYFNTVMSYGLLFWGNSQQSSRIFIMQKKKDNLNYDQL